MRKAAFCTLGCKVNQYETEAMIQMFKNAGYEIAGFEDVADVYVINTCTVTGLSARKSRQMIRRAKTKNKKSIVVVTGCYSQIAPEEVEGIRGVDIIIGSKEKSRVLELIDEFIQKGCKVNAVTDIMHHREYDDLRVDNYESRTRAFIKVQDGCKQFCAYCIIPYARGPVRSRPLDDIIDEIVRLAGNGFREVVLAGIHLASYGKDLKNTSLMQLVEEVHKVEGIDRIRLGSIEPMTITDEFVEKASKLSKLCPHYHLSLQSGCDETLKRMNRKYTTDFYRKAVAKLRSSIPDVAISTDIITGFPGETAEEFEKTVKFIDEISFAQMHVFKYSPRKGTPAALFKNQVDGEIKEQRSNILIELANRKTLEFNEKHIGKTMPVLFEQEANQGKDFYEGLTPNYIRVLCKGGSELRGNIRNVKLISADKDYVIGALE
jgi:threonylcarbamoyladenosine tRNA methylthiotransferase MtaB